MVSTIECTNCGFPLDGGVSVCPFCAADLSVVGATKRRLPTRDVVTPEPAFEPPTPPDSTADEPTGDVFESTYELDGYVPFDDEVSAANRDEHPRRFSPAIRAVAIVTGIAMVLSVVGATAWLAWAILGSR